MGATQGIRSTPVQKLRNRMRAVSTRAIAMPRASFTATEPNVKTNELTTARWKKPSHVSFT